jgi:hypothetical protein
MDNIIFNVFLYRVEGLWVIKSTEIRVEGLRVMDEPGKGIRTEITL